jgi:hypothetical protein
MPRDYKRVLAEAAARQAAAERLETPEESVV